MKAWVLHSVGDIRYDDVPEPVLQDGEVLVKVKSAGICSSDIPRIFVTGTYNYPLVPGHEFSGETDDGRRVAVFPLLPCFSCDFCKRGEYETCSSYDYIGSRRDGAFAGYVAVPSFNLIDIPADMDFETAAMLEPAAVALHAVRRPDLTCVSSAAVVGSGTIGQLAGKWLELEGVSDVRVFGRGVGGGSCSGNSVNGGGDGCNGNGGNSGSCFDACFEAVGSVEALQRCIELVRPGGQIVLIGNPDAAFSIDRPLYWQLLRKQITTHGVWNSRYPSDWQHAIEHADMLNLKGMITHRFPFDKAGDAFEFMRNPPQTGNPLTADPENKKCGKVMLVVGKA